MKENNNQNQNEEQSRQILLSVLAVAILVVAVVGVSFAAFTYTGTGKKENTITTGTITMEYTEDGPYISIEDAMPISEAAGKTITDTELNGAGKVGTGEGTPGGVFDFTVKASITGTVTIPYEIGAEKVPVTPVEPSEGNGNIGTVQLDDSAVMLYLVKDESTPGDGEEILAPTTFDAIPAGEGGDGHALTTEKKLGEGSFNATATHKYRLRMWIKEDFQMDSLNKDGKVNKGQFKVKVNVYGAATA